MPQNLPSNDIPPLRQLYFYLTEGCNLACRHCWLAPKYDPEGTRYGHLPVELFETAIREAMPLGLDRVKLTGGEPLLHPRFAELLDILEAYELGLTLETNGFLMTEALARRIGSYGRRFVAVSLDGADAATHEWVRGVPGSFERATCAVRTLAEHGTPPQIIMTLMRANADQVEAMVRLAESLGASSVKFNVLQPTARGERLHDSDGALGVEELIGLSRTVHTQLATCTSLRLYFDIPLAFRPLSHIASPDGCGVCGILGILGVIASGYYAMCGIGEHLEELVFGKVGRDRLSDVWCDHSTLGMIRQGLPDRLEGVCGTCIMRQRCLGACIAQNFYRNGTIWAPFWFCERASAEDLFPESRSIPKLRYSV